jgi:hypothetical protein
MARISKAYPVTAVAGIAALVAGAALQATGETKPGVTIGCSVPSESPGGADRRAGHVGEPGRDQTHHHVQHS